MRCRGTQQDPIEGKEGRGSEDRTDVVRIANAVKCDADSTRPRELVREFLHRSPTAWPALDEKAFVVRGPREAIDLAVVRLHAGDTMGRRPACEWLHIVVHRSRINDTHKVFRPACEDRQACTQPPVAFAPGWRPRLCALMLPST